MPHNQLDSESTHGAPSRELQHAPDDQDLDNEDDVGRYRYSAPEWLQTLIRGWRLLLLGAVVAAGVAAAVLYTQPKTYIAEALIAPVFSTTQVQFEPRIKTVDSSSQPASSASPERRQALLDLVNTGEIEAAVIRQLGGSATDTPSQPGQLVGRVKGLQRPKSEIIAIQAEADTPADAVAITNAWADGFVDLVNRVYAGTTSTNLDKLQTQRDDALASFQKNQDDLSAILQSNHLDELDRQIKDREHQIQTLQSPYQSGAFSAGANNSNNPPNPNAAQASDSSSSSSSSTATTNNQNSAPSVDASTARSDYRLAEVRTVDGLAETLRRLDVSRENMRVLLARLDGGAPSASDEAAMTVLKTQLVAMSSDLPQLQLQVTTSGSNGADSAAELQRLSDSIDQARTDVAREFNTRRADLEQQSATRTAALEDEVRGLKSQFEAATAARKQLTLKRDLSWDTYSALARKVEEQRVAQSSSGSEVEVASRAAVAVPSLPRTALMVGGAAIAGLFIAALILLLPLLVRSLQPYLSRRPKRALSVR